MRGAWNKQLGQRRNVVLAVHGDTGSGQSYTILLGEVPSFGRVVTKCGIYTCIYQTGN